MGRPLPLVSVQFFTSLLSHLNSRRFKKIALFLGLLAVAALLTGDLLAKRLLCIENPAIHADAIVVLGGESGSRTFKALEVFKKGLAPRIIVTGIGDGTLIRDRLVLAGVPEDRMQLESNARNTLENAKLSIDMLRQSGCKKVIVVTSWYHARRALACFKHFGENMEFYSMPAFDGADVECKPSLEKTPYIVHEYIGLAWYCVRSGISPF